MRRLVAVLPACALLLAGCGSAQHSAARTSPAGTSAATALPAVSGSFGAKPTLTFPGPTPPAGEQRKVLRAGHGAVVAKSDLLVADYLGQVWNGKVFDNSYDRGAPTGFPIGVGQVITGWDDLLVGAQVGSRVLLSIPPDKGYGSSGNAQAGIKGTDTLEFVIDIVGAYPSSVHGDPTATAAAKAPAGITVGGQLGKPPTLTVSKAAKAPTANKLTVLARGHGAPIGAGLLVAQLVATDFTGKSAGSTYTSGSPAGINIDKTGNASVFDAVRGLPLGSRVLVEVPAQSGSPAVAAVADLIAEPTAAGAS